MEFDPFASQAPLEIEIETAGLARAVLKVEQQRVGRKQHRR